MFARTAPLIRPAATFSPRCGEKGSYRNFRRPCELQQQIRPRAAPAFAITGF